MKSKRSTLKFLLDTSFILPTLGIGVGIEVREALRELNEKNAEIYYSNFNILESLWIAIRLLKKSKFNAERFELGLRSLIESKRYKLIIEQTSTFTNALKLYTMGHQDIIDNILYSDAVYYDLRLLTLDDELKEFIQKNKLRDITILPSEIK